METATLERTEIYHRNFNLDKKHNLDSLPAEAGVIGIFAIVNEEPINCRYMGETDNIRKAVEQLFENPPGEGMKKFMQGAWVQMLVFEPMPGSTQDQRQAKCGEWSEKHNPKIDDEGEYPGYYDY